MIHAAPTPLTPDTLPRGAEVEYCQGGQVALAPKGSGVWNVLFAIGNAVRPVANFNVITMLPFSAKKNGRVGLYYVGTWPSEKGAVGAVEGAIVGVRESGGLHRGHASRTPTRRCPSTSSFVTFSRTISRTSGRSTLCFNRS